MGLFKTITSPLVGFSNPAKILSRVDFPEPLGPNKHINSCSSTEIFISFNASIF